MGRGGKRRKGTASGNQSPSRGAGNAGVPSLAAAAAKAAADRSTRDREFESFLERVKKQVEFYFSDANLRRDAFLQRKIKEGNGFVELSLLLSFNRMKALKCFNAEQLEQAIRKSPMLALSEDQLKVGRDSVKAPVEEIDPVNRSIYVEGLPITFGIDELTEFFSKHGRVCLVELPRHRQTREPRGFCFVEYSSNAEAASAVATLNGTWPNAWPVRYDAKTLRAMTKVLWQDYKKEFQALERSSRRGTPMRVETVGEGISDTAPAISSTTPPPTAVEASSRSDSATPLDGSATAEPATSSTAPRIRRGCLLRISGFSQPQTRLSLRQFVEHAVPVEYCDFEPGEAQGYVRLRCAEDCKFLLRDLELTERLLGWVRPEVSILPPDEEERYWQEVASRRAASSPASASLPDPSAPGSTQEGGAASSSGGVGTKPQRLQRRLRRPQDMFPNPEGAVINGPTKASVVYRFSSDPQEQRRKQRGSGAAPETASNSQSSSFVDTAAGCSTFGQAGFGKPRAVRRRMFATKVRRKPVELSPRLRTMPPPPVPRGAPKTVVVAPKTVVVAPPSMTDDESEMELGSPGSKLFRPEPPESWMPPPSPIAIPPKVIKPPRVIKPPARQSVPEMLFPPPSPVAVQQAPAKRKRTASPVVQPARKASTGVASFVLPPPSPIARPPEQRRSPVNPPGPLEAAGPASPVPGAAAGASDTTTEEATQKDTSRDDSMLDKIDLDELESLMD